MGYTGTCEHYMQHHLHTVVVSLGYMIVLRSVFRRCENRKTAEVVSKARDAVSRGLSVYAHPHGPLLVRVKPRVHPPPFNLVASSVGLSDRTGSINSSGGSGRTT